MKPGAVTVPIALRDLNNSPIEGATLACTVSIDGAAFVPSTNTATEVGGGDYALALTAAERGTAYTRVKATNGTYTTLVTVTTDEVMRGTDGALLAEDYTAPPTDYAKKEDVQITVPEPVFAGTVTFSGTVEAPAVTVNPTLTPEESAKLLGAAQEATVATIPTAEHNAEAVDALLSAIHGAGSWEGGVPTEGVLITQDSIGDDDLPLGPIMPYGTLSAYLGEDLEYVFDEIGDANGNFAITLPYGATWTLVASNPPHYRNTTAVITTPPHP